jgi:hypothetical protein
MSKLKRSHYLSLRRCYEPKNISLVVIAESPPASGVYFYNPAGAVTEPLFAALTRQLGLSPVTKKDGLREFQRRGWVLVDATYEPVNQLNPVSCGSTRAPAPRKLLSSNTPLPVGSLASSAALRAIPTRHGCSFWKNART